MSRRNSIVMANAATGLLSTLVGSVLSLILTRVILIRFGSDANGVNSVSTRLISLLLILEGGLTTATNVMLFEPFRKGKMLLVGKILNTTRRRFSIIAVLFAICGLATSAAYSLAVQSNLSPRVVFDLLFMAVIPQSVNLWYAAKYRVLFQAEQKDYVLTLVTLCALVVGQVSAILIVDRGGDLEWVRIAPMIASISGSLFIGWLARRTYPVAKEIPKTDGVPIPGMRHLIGLKTANAVYGAMPMVVLSLAPSIGTKIASVYAVYFAVVSFAKAGVSAMSNGVVLGLGSLIAQSGKEAVHRVLLQFELVIFILASSLFAVSITLSVPFAVTYTRGVNDASYNDLVLAVILGLTGFFEVIHWPSGQVILMSGRFKVSASIQWISVAVLAVSMTLGVVLLGFRGVLLSPLFTAITTGAMEVAYVRSRYFRRGWSGFFRVALPCMALFAGLCIVEVRLCSNLQNYTELGLWGIGLTTINVLLCVGLAMLTNRPTALMLLARVRSLDPRKDHGRYQGT